MIKAAIAKVVEGRNLTEQEAHDVVLEVMEGNATPAQIAALLTALRMKGETVEEITGAARVMREKAARIEARDPRVVDTCGTGGDRSGTFNISTTAALVVAGAGLTVAKHGNRSVSSACGSADVLQALGVNIDLEPKDVEACLNTVGIAFLFAPRFHGAMKHAIGPRREIGIRTLFNILGPLTNPADAKIQVLGVYDPRLTEPMAMVLGNLGAHRAFVVHGSDGLDEITITGPTRLSEWAHGRVVTYDLDPRDYGIARGRLRDLEGGDAETNARITLAVLEGEPGPKRDIVVLNAAAALVAAERAKDFAEGLTLAREAIDSGRAMEKLEALRRFTHAPQHV